jgi:integrase
MTLSVRQSRTEAGSKVVVGTPKTASSARIIGIDAATVSALRALKARQASERLALGPAYSNPDGYVAVDEDGRPMHPNRLTRAFKRVVDANQLPSIPLHGLRHSYATAGMEAGVPLKVISVRLGHSSTRITADTYSHVRPAVDAEAASAVAETIYGAEESGA